MVNSLTNKLTLSDLWVSRYEKPSDFFISSWQRGESPVPMLVVRFLLAVVTLGILIWAVLNHHGSPYWIIFLTNWGVVLLAGTMVSGLVVSLMATCKKYLSESDGLPWYISIYWLLSNINVTIAILITILYWALIYDSENAQDPEDFGLSITTHAINSGLALSELLASRTPVKLPHFYQPVGFGLWYAAFSGIYYAAGGLNEDGEPFIYNVLDWRNGGRTTGIVAMSAVGALVAFFVVWALVKARDKLSEVTVRMTRQDLTPAPPLTPEPDRTTRIV